MDNQKSEEKEKQELVSNSHAPTPVVETTSIIEKADEIVKRLNEANKKAEELLQKQESILARNLLSGKAEAGHSEPKKEETPKEYKDRIMKGQI